VLLATTTHMAALIRVLGVAPGNELTITSATTIETLRPRSTKVAGS